MMLKSVFFLLLCFGISQADKLSVSGTSLVYKGEEIYMNGANAAWSVYGQDFGNGKYNGTLEAWMADISAAGGNSFRIWVHVEGYNTPLFDENGWVTACDSTGDFINDIITFLDAAEASNILVTLTLWNGAVVTNQVYIDLIRDPNKLQSYLDNCLTQLAQAVAGHPALGAWESINEPEGLAMNETSINHCYDTSPIMAWGAGWTGLNIPMQRILSFIGKINTVIRENDPTSLITVGAQTQFSSTDAFEDTTNFYSDECLNGAAESETAGIDFAQVHAYSWGDYWTPHAPFTVAAEDYELGKPVVIGEFASICAAGTGLEDLHEYSYNNGYSGTLTWHWVATGECSDTTDYQRQALAHLADRTENGVVDIEVS